MILVTQFPQKVYESKIRIVLHTRIVEGIKTLIICNTMQQMLQLHVGIAIIPFPVGRFHKSSWFS